MIESLTLLNKETLSDYYDDLHTRYQLSLRKQRLFCVAICRLLWDHITFPPARDAIEIAERVADGSSEHDAMHIACEEADNEDNRTKPYGINWLAVRASMSDPENPRYPYVFDHHCPNSIIRNAIDLWPEVLHDTANLLDDILGRTGILPVSYLLHWHDGIIPAMAQSMYDARDFTDMPILADALEEAGVINEVILSHCREKNTLHARGCWVLDMILGKS